VADNNYPSFHIEAITDRSVFIVENLRISELREYTSRIEFAIQAPVSFKLCLGTSEEDVKQKLDAGESTHSNLDFVTGVNIDIKQTSEVNIQASEGFTIAELENQNQDLKDELASLEAFINKLEEDHAKELADINSALTLSEAEVTKLKSDIEKLEDDKERLTQKLVDAENALQLAQDNLTLPDGTQIDAEAYSSLLLDIRELEELLEIAPTQEQIDAIQTQLNQANENLDATNQIIGETGFTPETLVGGFNDIVKKIQGLEEENDQYVLDLDAASIQNNQLKEELDNAIEKQKLLRQELDIALEDVQKKNQIIIDLEEEKTEILSGVYQLIEGFTRAITQLQNSFIDNPDEVSASNLTQYGVSLIGVNEKIQTLSKGIQNIKNELDEALALQTTSITNVDINNMIEEIALLSSTNSDLENQILELQGYGVLTNLVVNGNFDEGGNNWDIKEPLNFGVGVSGLSDSLSIASFSEPKLTSTVSQNLGSSITDGSYVFRSLVSIKEGDGAFTFDITDVDGNSVVKRVDNEFGRTKGSFAILFNISQEPSLIGKNLTLIIRPYGDPVSGIDNARANSDIISFPTRVVIDDIGLFKMPSNLNITQSVFNDFIDSGLNILSNLNESSTSINQSLEIELLTQKNDDLSKDVVNLVGLFDLLNKNIRSVIEDKDPAIIQDLTFNSSQSSDTLNSLTSTFNNNTSELQNKILFQKNLIRKLQNQLTLFINSESIINDPLSSTYRFTLTGGDILGSSISNDLFNLDVFNFKESDLLIYFRNTSIPEFKSFSTSTYSQTKFVPNQVQVNLFSKKNLLTGNSNTSLVGAFILNCSFSDFNSTHDIGGSEIPHTHSYSFLTENHGYITFLFKILNFNDKTTFDNESPALAEAMRPSISKDVTSGLQFEITIQGGPSRGWEFAVSQHDSLVSLNDDKSTREWSIVNNLKLSDYNLSSDKKWMNEDPIDISLIGEKISSNEAGDNYASSISRSYLGASTRMTKII